MIDESFQIRGGAQVGHATVQKQDTFRTSFYMAFVNLYQPPPPQKLAGSAAWGPDPYDVNFAFPVREVQNDVVKITPFIPREHADAFLTSSLPHLEALYKWMPFGLPTHESLLDFVEQFMRQDPTRCLFAIIDKTRLGDFDGTLAGIIGLINTDASRLVSEVGPVIVLPEFQRTHVTRNAVGLLLQWCMELPSVPKRGLGLRRVTWLAHPDNAASTMTALKMGFRDEGIMRFYLVSPISFHSGMKTLREIAGATAREERYRRSWAGGRSQERVRRPTQSDACPVLG